MLNFGKLKNIFLAVIVAVLFAGRLLHSNKQTGRGE